MKYILISLSVILFFSACTKEETMTDYPKNITVNLDEFEAIKSIHPFDQIKTTPMSDYWELTLQDGYNSIMRPVFSEGYKCSNSTDSLNCITQLDSLKEQFGFVPVCLPGDCFYFIKYQVGDSINSVNENDELIQFLGEINTKSESILLVFLNDYYYSVNNKELGAIKETAEGYEMIVLKTVNYCKVQTDRFHLLVEKNGSITVIAQEIHSKSENCI